MTDLLTSSSLRDARACMRLYQYKHLLLVRPRREDEVLFFGTLMHLGLEAWWKSMQRGDAPDAWLDCALDAIGDTANPFDRAKAEVMLTGYHLRWKDLPFHVIHVEAQFDVPLVNPETGAPSRTWGLGGKVDVLVRDLRDDLVKLVEHKTSSEDISQGSDYWKRLRLDGQVSTYFDGGQSLVAEPIASCVYDVLLKPALRPSSTVPVVDGEGLKIVLDASGNRVKNKDGKRWRQTASTEDGFVLQVRDETPEEYQLRLTEAVTVSPEKFFARAEVVRIGDELDEFRFDTWQISKSIHEYRKAGRFPKNPDSCNRYGRTCPFFAVCSGEASLDDSTLFTRLERPHPELSGAAEQAQPEAQQ